MTTPEPGPPIDPDGNPYRRLVQQHYAHDPWKQTVCCILLNRTRRCVLDRIRHRLFRAFPNPAAMAAADPARISRIIRSLGFQNRRARALIRFSAEYDEWDRAGRPGGSEGLRDLYAVGDYAVDSWAIFVDGRRDVAPTDLKLIWWLAERA